MSDQTPNPAAPSAANRPLEQPPLWKWVFWVICTRLGMSLLVSISFAFVSGLLSSYYEQWVFLHRHNIPWRWINWIMMSSGEFDLGRALLTGGLFGLLVPNFNFPCPQWLTAIGLCGLIGMLVGPMTLSTMDSFMQDNAIQRVKAARASNNKNERPHLLLSSKFYPSIYRSLFTSAMLGGSAVGLLLGCGWITTGKWRTAWITIGLLCAFGLMVRAWSIADAARERYIEFVTTRP